MGSITRVFQETLVFLGSLMRPAARSVRENSGLAVLSVVLAFGLWIFVTDSENPTRTRVLPVDIPVAATNIPSDVALADELPPVRVRIRVADDVFETLTAADFSATVDLDGLTVGEYDLPVEVRAETSRGGLRIESVLPDTITVRLAQLTSKQVPVQVDVQGELPSGFTMSEPELDEQTVFVTGPQAQVDKVTQATAAIDVDARTESIDQAIRLSPRDSQGVLVPNVNLDPRIVQLRVDIEQEKFARSMAVSPALTGTPADGYNVVAVSVNPPSVTVRGEEAFITGTVSIPTKPVDLGDASDDIVRTVSLDLPSGAEVTGGVPVVTVTVKIEPATGVVTFQVPVTAGGLEDGVAIRGALPSVQVSLFGPLPTLTALTPNDIAASVDLGGKGPGTHTVTVRATVGDDDIDVRSVNPAQVEVVLEER